MECEQNLADVWVKVEFVSRTTDQSCLPFSPIFESHTTSPDGRIDMGVKPEPPQRSYLTVSFGRNTIHIEHNHLSVERFLVFLSQWGERGHDSNKQCILSTT